MDTLQGFQGVPIAVGHFIDSFFRDQLNVLGIERYSALFVQIQ